MFAALRAVPTLAVKQVRISFVFPWPSIAKMLGSSFPAAEFDNNLRDQVSHENEWNHEQRTYQPNGQGNPFADILNPGDHRVCE